MKKQILSFILIMSFSLSSFAQAPSQATTKKSGPKKQAATIIFAGLGGAILGLSTLSFYGRPQDKLSNIAIGAAVGIIIGTVYTVYKAASAPSEFYGPHFPPEPSNHHQLTQNGFAPVLTHAFEF